MVYEEISRDAADHTLEIFDNNADAFSPGTIVARNVEFIQFSDGPVRSVTAADLGVPHADWHWV